MQQSQYCSHCWKQCLKSSTKMLSRAASSYHWSYASANTSLSNPDSFLDTKKKSSTQLVWVSRVSGTQPQFCLWPKRWHFADAVDVPREPQAALDSISVEDFRQCFQQWGRCWDHRIQSQGECFRGDQSFKLLWIFWIKFLTISGILAPPLILYKYENKASRDVGQPHTNCSN
jgi:hypothetical protein